MSRLTNPTAGFEALSAFFYEHRVSPNHQKLYDYYVNDQDNLEIHKTDGSKWRVIESEGEYKFYAIVASDQPSRERLLGDLHESLRAVKRGGDALYHLRLLTTKLDDLLEEVGNPMGYPGEPK